MASHLSLSSEDLVQACAGSRDESAWLEFIRRFQPLIAKIVSRTTRRNWPQAPPHLVDDLVQETYLKLCADDRHLLRQFRSRHHDSIFGFLKVVAASVVLDHFKAELASKRDASQTDAIVDPGPMDRLAAGRRGGLSIEDKITLRQIDDILGKHYTGDVLARNRTIFWFHHRHGMTAQEIASIPGIKLNTKGVETALRRMKQLIQSHIENNGEGF